MYFGGKDGEVFKIENGEIGKPSEINSDIYECPKARAYTTDRKQVKSQRGLDKLMCERLGNQGRSVDATGIRLMELFDGNIRAYGDRRRATKPWDILPSWLILEAAGIKVTDPLGFKFDKAIFYDERNDDFEETGGVNMEVGKEVLAADPETHFEICMGEGKRIPGKNNYTVWDEALIDVLNPHFRYTYRDTRPEDWDEIGIKFGRKAAETVLGSIEDKKEAYKNLDEENVNNIIETVYNKYVNNISADRIQEDFASQEPLHLKAFREVIESARFSTENLTLEVQEEYEFPDYK